VGSADGFDELVAGPRRDVADAIREVVDEVNADQERKAHLRPQPVCRLRRDGIRGRPVVEPIAPSTWEYINAPSIAALYDACFRYNELFDYDTQVLDEWFREPDTLIDLGCGTGRHAAHFAGKGFEVTGVDLSPHMLAAAADRLREAGAEARLLRGDINDLGSFPDAGFRYAICMFSTVGLIRGGENRLEFMKQVRRLLKPDGLFVFHTHNVFHALWTPADLLWVVGAAARSVLGFAEFGDRILPEYRGLSRMYLHLFRQGEIRALVRAAGFEVARLIHLNQRRDGPHAGRIARGLRANGFIVVCRPGPGPP